MKYCSDCGGLLIDVNKEAWSVEKHCEACGAKWEITFGDWGAPDYSTKLPKDS